jgi:hypothetical protein
MAKPDGTNTNANAMGTNETSTAAKISGRVGAGIDTGIGGFEIDGKTYALDVISENEQPVDPVETDHGDMSQPAPKKDVSKQTRETLGRYLSTSTHGGHGYAKGTPNYYFVDYKTSETSVSDEKGYPIPPSPQNENGFAGGEYQRIDQTYSRDYPTIANQLNKGKKLSPPGAANGNNLLIGDVDQPRVIAKKYASAVLSHNRFSAEEPIIDPALSSNPPADFDTTVKIPGFEKPVSFMKMAQVGAALSLRASGEVLSGEDGFNPNSSAALEASFLPSPNQMGITKVDNQLLSARDVLERLSSDEYPTDALVEIAPFGGQSWGAVNNVNEPFVGALNVGQIALSLALTAGVLVVFEVVGTLISIGSETTPALKKRDDMYKLGSSTYDSLTDPNDTSFPPNMMALLGLHGTVYPFGTALQTGAAAFFLGAKAAMGGVGSQVIGALSSAMTGVLDDTTSAGFNINVARTIVRSGQIIAEAINKIADAFARNPIAGVQGAVGILRVIKSSKIIAAMNVFTTLGDAVLATVASKSDENVSHLDVNRLPNDVPHANVKKSRLKDSSGNTCAKLAWASSRAPSLYLIPDSTMTMQLLDDKLGGFRGPLGLTDTNSRTFFAATTNDGTKRIPRTSKAMDEPTVKKMESMLEAEYVPFYFHDLRTNEIVGFHAFLSSLGENYVANYESPEGFGRVDPVKIYKSTARKIDLSFYVVATSKQDFDDMWMKINKLVTLIYPQYTRGRSIVADDGTTFIQPFSQLIGSSPLIRLRVGDLIRSNYSRFALARLFGADSDVMSIGGNNGGNKIEFRGYAQYKDRIKTVIDSIWSSPSGKTFHVDSDGFPAAPNAVSAPGSSPPVQVFDLGGSLADLDYFIFLGKGLKVNALNQYLSVLATCELITADELIQAGYASAEANRIIGELSKKYVKFIGLDFIINHNILKPSRKAMHEALATIGISGAEDVDALSNFLSEKTNAITRSFRTTRGKGLAGVIESMGFEWFDSLWETETPGRIAPMSCKVTLAFSPIHDVSPGIDHHGYNRAPIYPVGAAMKHGFDLESED